MSRISGHVHILEKFPKWKVNYNDNDNSVHLFHFSGNDGYAEIEVINNSDKTWIIMLEGKLQCNANLEWADIPLQLNLVSELQQTPTVAVSHTGFAHL
jgi:hypothetical protein